MHEIQTALQTQPLMTRTAPRTRHTHYTTNDKNTVELLHSPQSLRLHHLKFLMKAGVN